MLGEKHGRQKEEIYIENENLNKKKKKSEKENNPSEKSSISYSNQRKDYYFNSYSSYSIHEEMLKDKTRTGAYQKAILGNSYLFKDKIVLDVGSGTGILSFFAAQAGAEHVYGIEYADIADYSIEIIKKNGMEKKITIIKARVEEAELPVEKVDIILSEWMGYFLLYESMLDCVLFARDKWLKKDGIMFPDRAQMFLAGLEDRIYKYKKINSWNNIYGFNMNCIKEVAIAEPLIDSCKKEFINSSICKIYDIDLYKVTKEELDFMSGYQIEFNKNECFNGLVTWFNVSFNKVKNKVLLGTSPFDKRTHWEQTIFYIEEDIFVKKGEKLWGNIAVIKDKKNFRFINIKISYHFNDKKKVLVQQYKIT